MKKWLGTRANPQTFKSFKLFILYKGIADRIMFWGHDEGAYTMIRLMLNRKYNTQGQTVQCMKRKLANLPMPAYKKIPDKRIQHNIIQYDAIQYNTI